MIGQTFWNPWKHKFICLCQMILYAGWGMSSTFSHTVDNSALASTSCLYRGSRSMRGECFGLSQSFLGIHITLCIHVAFLDSKKYVGVFQITYVQLIPQLFFLNFLVSLFFDPKVIHCLWQRQLKYLYVKPFIGIPQVVILAL